MKLADPKEAMRFLELSTAPLKDGKEECSLLADKVKTVGALVQKYRRKANEEKSVHCDLQNLTWSCEANFVYNDRDESEKDFAVVLRLQVEDASGKIRDLTCFLAG